MGESSEGSNDVSESNYLIVFLDILGYKEKVRKGNVSKEKLLKSTIELVSEIKSIPDYCKFDDEIIGVRTFSDNFLIYYKLNEELTHRDASIVFDILYRVCYTQYCFLGQYKLMIRGGVVIDKMYVNDDIVFGEGLIASYELENKVAIYPRIVLDDNTFNELIKISKLLPSRIDTDFIMPQDYDGVRYLDYYRFINPHYNLDPDNDSMKELYSKMESIRDTLLSLITEYRDENLHHCQKLSWSIHLYDDDCNIFGLKSKKIFPME